MDPYQHRQLKFRQDSVVQKPDGELVDGQLLAVGNVDVQVRHTPD